MPAVRSLGKFGSQIQVGCRNTGPSVMPAAVNHALSATTGHATASGLSVISVFDGGLRALFDGWISVDRFPDATERAAVLAAVKDAARR
jgi:hypothetical protein